MIEKYKHIIWDWNGTLFNDVDLCLSIINRILSYQNIQPLNKQKYLEIFTFPVEKYYAEAGLDFNLHSFEELGRDWMNEYESRKHECKLYNSAPNLLKIFSEEGIGQSILSAYSQNSLKQMVNNYDIGDYFINLAGLDHIYATSKIELGKELIKKIAPEDHEVLLIGDTLHDFEVAEAIGADCVLISEGHQSKSRLLKCGVPVFESLTHFTDTLK